MSATPRDLFTMQADDRHRLMLVDGMALFYRAHFALSQNPRYTSTGLCTSAIFGFCNTILDLLDREKPSHVAVALDTPEPTHRHVAFPDYKAQREEMPEDLSRQLPWLDRLLGALRIPLLRLPGWEADDIVGTLSRQAERDGFAALLVSPDKDYQQLVTEHVLVWRPGRHGGQFEILGIAEVLQRWQVREVSQVIDILGLMGDASDNVPGIPGIGEKTAQKLIAEFGSIEELLANTAKLTGKRRELVEKYADQARLSKQLVTIDTHVPHEWSWTSMERQAWDSAALAALFVELEFRTLGERVLGRGFEKNLTAMAPAKDPTSGVVNRQTTLFDEPTSERTVRDIPHSYHHVSSADDRRDLIVRMLQQPAFCLDLETTSLDARIAQPVGMAIAWQPGEAFFVTLPDEREECCQVLHEFLPLLQHPTIEKIGHNLKYDLTVLRWHGIEVQGPVFDTMLAHTLIDPDSKHGMDHLSLVYLNYRPIPIRDLIGDPQQRSIREVPISQLVEYACEDADVTWQLAQITKRELMEQGIEHVCREIECPLIPVLVEMEFHGIRLNVDALRSFALQLTHDIEALRRDIYQAAGHEFNIDSPKQLGVVLYDELKLDAKPTKTATGQYSTRESELQKLMTRHPIVGQVLDYRNAVKLKSVYVDQLPESVDQRTGRIHTVYSQAWTATGRMQSADPNLQTIPVRKERGREIRAAFVPCDKDHLLLSADYSQIELRIMAALSHDVGMIEAFREGLDIHVATAAKVFKVAIDEVTRSMRDTAKTVNFGILYGISAFGLQQRLGIPRQEAQSLIESYFTTYPDVKKYIDHTVAFAHEHGYVQTLSGRRRYLRDIHSKNNTLRNAAERLAMNSPIQGTAADLLKQAMVRVFQRLKGGDYRTKMLLTVHDEIVFDLVCDEQEAVVPIIRDAMQTVWDLEVPLVVDIGIGSNWLEAHS